jgi:hypothetical protein
MIEAQLTTDSAHGLHKRVKLSSVGFAQRAWFRELIRKSFQTAKQHGALEWKILLSGIHQLQDTDVMPSMSQV